MGCGRGAAGRGRGCVALLALVLCPAPAGGWTEGEIDAALRAALGGPAGRRGFRLHAECLTDGGWRSVALFERGLGIWNREKQFMLSEPQLRKLFRAFGRHGFARLRQDYGRRADPRTPGLALKLTCRVALRLGAVEKQVTQLEPGPRSPELFRLAGEVLGLCEKAARGGRGAASLSDGLRGLAAGRLAPETLSVLLNRRPDAGSGEAPWLLRLEGRRASLRTGEDGGGPARVLDLAAEDVASLAARLAQGGLEAWPRNLYASAYTDLAVAVLNHEKSVQARAWAGMSPARHGLRQEAFDRVVEELRVLGRRVLSEGRAAPLPDPSSE